MELGIALVFMIGLPIAYLYQARKPRGFALSVLFVVVAAVTALWAINQSRSDWASMGYFLVPGDAALAGILSLTFSRKKDAAVRDLRILAWLALAGSILIVVFNVVDGIHSISRNRAEDEYDELTFGQYNREKASIGSYLQKHRGRETAWLDSSIRTRMQDSLFLSVALETGFVSPDLLDTLARSPFPRVALSAIGNPKTRGETLVSAYRAHADSNIFVEMLAHNRNAPADLLREIYRRPNNSMATDGALAANQATPRDVLQGLATSAKYPETIYALLDRNAPDCPLAEEITAYLTGKGKFLVRDYNVGIFNARMPKLCAQAPSLHSAGP
jgi:hypothetical protein